MKGKTKDIVRRHWGYAVKTVVVGLLLLLLATGVLAATLARKEEEAVPLTSTRKGLLMETTLTAVGGPFAINDANGNAYYLALTEQDQVLILEVDDETNRAWQVWLSDADSLEEVLPLTVTGRLQKTDRRLKPLAARAHQLHLPEEEAPEETDPLFSYLLSTTAMTSPVNSLQIAAAIGGFLALVILAIGLAALMRMKKIRAWLYRHAPERQDFSYVEDEADFTLKNPHLFVYQDVLFVESTGLYMADLSTSAWVVLYIQKRRQASTPYLRIYSAEQRNHRRVLPLGAGVKDVSEKLQPFWDYLTEKYPRILQGSGVEIRAKYRARFLSR